MPRLERLERARPREKHIAGIRHARCEVRLVPILADIFGIIFVSFSGIPTLHHIALTGPAGIGKSALALEAAERSREKFPGGVIGVSLQGGKSYEEALIEIAHFLHISARAVQTANPTARARQVLNAFQPLADRGLPCLRSRAS